LRPIVVPQAAKLEAWIRIEPLDVPNYITFGVAGTGKGYRAGAGKSAKWTRTDKGLVRENASEAAIMPGGWTKIVIAVESLGLKPGDTLTGISLVENGGVCYWDNIAILGDAEPASDPLESLAAWRKALGTTLPPDLPADLNEIVKGGAAKTLSDDDAAKLRR